LHTLTPDIVSLVRGPAKIEIIGRATILGKDVSDSRISIEEGRILPVETDSSCKISIVSELEEKNDDDNTDKILIFSSFEAGTKIWKDVVYRIFFSSPSSNNYPQSIMLVGPTDSGKTTLSTYIINEAIKNSLKPAIIDADIGQGDLAPPNAIGCGIATKQILDLRKVPTKHFAFIGSTNPSGFDRLITRSAGSLFNKLREEEDNVDLIIINTDGYIAESGLIGKISVANKLKPDIIICLSENSCSLWHQLRSNLTSAGNTTTSIMYAKSPTTNGGNILKSQAQRRRQRLDQFHRYITGLGKDVRGKTVTLRLKKIKFVYRGLTYFKGLVVQDNNNDLILINKLKTIRISQKSIVNMFVGLGLGNNITGFGIVSNISKKQTIIIQTNIDRADRVYLSNTGINRQTWKPYMIDFRKSKKG